MNKIKFLAFDADDTLWVNEPYFREAEDKFSGLLEDYLSHHRVTQELYKTELDNLPLYGYGIKGFMLSMLETAERVSEGDLNNRQINYILDLGKEMLGRPIELLEGVEDTLASLQDHYVLIVATKGDLLDQQRKLEKSGLSKYFHHVEVMSEKKERDYSKLLSRLRCQPSDFLMVGNSLKSDVLPPLKIGAQSIHIPYHTTWIHESIPNDVSHPSYIKTDSIRNIPKLLKEL